MSCHLTTSPFNQVFLTPGKIPQKRIACKIKIAENTPKGNVLIGDNYLLSLDDTKKRHTSNPKQQKVLFPYLNIKKEKLFTEGNYIQNSQKNFSIETEKFQENKSKNLILTTKKNNDNRNLTQGSYEQKNSLHFNLLPSIKKKNKIISLNKETPIDLYTGFNACKNYDNHILKVLSVNTILENKNPENTKTIINKKNDLTKNNEKKFGLETQNIMEGEEENKNKKNKLIIGSKFLDNDISPDAEAKNDYYKRLNAAINQMKHKPVSLNKTQNLTSLQIHRQQLKNYKKKTLLKNKQAVANTLKEVLNSKNNCLEYIDRFRKSFDVFDNWCSPENTENLYDK